MLHVFIDTNVLLRFYAYSDDSLTEVEKLSALIKTGKITLLITEQIVDEHARNRDNVLAESLKRLEQMPTAVQMPRFAEHHESAQKLMAAIKEAKGAKSGLLDAIRTEMTEGALRADRVILEMFASTKPLVRTGEIIERARLRRELGNPPGKPESIGDQINWEILLDHVPSETDLHIISKDGDFGSGTVQGRAGYFLRSEWSYKKEAGLYLYKGLAEFAEQHFPDIKVPSDAVKAVAMESLIKSTSYAQTHSAISDLTKIFEDLSHNDAVALLTAVTYNTQISDIIHDDDVKKFYHKLFDAYWIFTPSELDDALEAISKEVFPNPL